MSKKRDFNGEEVSFIKQLIDAARKDVVADKQKQESYQINDITFGISQEHPDSFGVVPVYAEIPQGKYLLESERGFQAGSNKYLQEVIKNYGTKIDPTEGFGEDTQKMWLRTFQEDYKKLKDHIYKEEVFTVDKTFTEQVQTILNKFVKFFRILCNDYKKLEPEAEFQDRLESTIVEGFAENKKNFHLSKARSEIDKMRGDEVIDLTKASYHNLNQHKTEVFKISQQLLRGEEDFKFNENQGKLKKTEVPFPKTHTKSSPKVFASPNPKISSSKTRGLIPRDESLSYMEKMMGDVGFDLRHDSQTILSDKIPASQKQEKAIKGKFTSKDRPKSPTSVTGIR